MEPLRPILITLVHGTFAPGAAWTRDDSPLCTALRERFPGASIGAFTWSGHNSNRARLDAALELAQWTETRITEYQREHGGPIDHYVIAHSHGGNVALYACRSRHFADHLTKLVCLSTPFLSARIRYQSRMILITLVMGLLIWGAALAVFLGVRLWVAVAGAFAMLLGVAAFMKRALDRFEERAGDIAEELSPPTVNAKSVLIVRGDRDEATGALVWAHFPTAVVSLIWGWFGKAIKGPDRNRLQHDTGIGRELVDLARSSAGLFLYALMALVAVATIPLFALATLPFGLRSEMWGQSLLLEIAADVTPPGSWTVHRLRDFPFNDPRLDGVLRHSFSYEHENAIKVIVEWLRSGAVPDESSWDVRLWHRLRDG